jgi:LysM repeat protein
MTKKRSDIMTCKIDFMALKGHNGFKGLIGFMAIIGLMAANAQDVASARQAYQQQQAILEVQRLSQQFDQLSANQESLAGRMARIEEGAAVGDLRAEISALKAQIADLRREQESMRREIVADLAKRIAALPRPAPAPQPTYTPPAAPPSRKGGATRPAPPPPPQPEYTGSYYEHEVKPGQTLSEISKGFDVPISKILQANPGLKPNALRVGQKIKVPAEDGK